MFENGSYLRRRKRFKLLKKSYEEKAAKEKNPVSAPSTNRSPIKSSFFIDHLLGNDVNTNASYTSSSSSTETNCSGLLNVVHSNDWNIARKLAFLSDMHGQQQQIYW
jgi:hypothetical protein